MFGFMGFGKTTIAKQLEKETSGICLNHDEIMVEKYGRNPDDFQQKYEIVDEYIKKQTKKHICNGIDVILDYGFWTHDLRQKYYNWAKSITDDVVFHITECDLDIAKQRVLNRTQNDKNSLIIDENTFDLCLKTYEPWNLQDDFPVVLHGVPSSCYIGKSVQVKIDRPIHSKHPKYGYEYPINYGYIPFTQSGDGEELDAYIMAIKNPLEKYVGRCIGVIHRTNDDDDKLIVAPNGYNFTDEEIENCIGFQEKWFKHVLLRS